MAAVAVNVIAVVIVCDTRHAWATSGLISMHCDKYSHTLDEDIDSNENEMGAIFSSTSLELYMLTTMWTLNRRSESDPETSAARRSVHR